MSKIVNLPINVYRIQYIIISDLQSSGNNVWLLNAAEGSPLTCFVEGSDTFPITWVDGDDVAIVDSDDIFKIEDKNGGGTSRSELTKRKVDSADQQTYKCLVGKAESPIAVVVTGK